MLVDTCRQRKDLLMDGASHFGISHTNTKRIGPYMRVKLVLAVDRLFLKTGRCEGPKKLLEPYQ